MSRLIGIDPEINEEQNHWAMHLTIITLKNYQT